MPFFSAGKNAPSKGSHSCQLVVSTLEKLSTAFLRNVSLQLRKLQYAVGGGLESQFPAYVIQA